MRSLAVVCALTWGLLAEGGDAQAPSQLTAADYARAERLLDASTAPLVFGASVTPRWLPDGRFWYANRVRGGTEYVLVDPARPSRGRAFDHERLARALTPVSGRLVPPLDLGITAMAFEGSGVTVTIGDATYRCDLGGYRCEEGVAVRRTSASEVPSPDGRLTAFIKDHDLWVRDIAAGVERRVSMDGQEDFGYATDNAGWTRSDRPVLHWSPDSRRIATFQHDERGVGMMYVTSTNVGHPELLAWRYPLVGDSLIFRISRVVIDLDRPVGDQVVRLDLPPDPHRSTCSDHVRCGGRLGDVEWAEDGSGLVFVSSSRDHKSARVRRADPSNGRVTDLFEEVAPTFFESHGNWRYLSAADQVLWYSQRDGWGHLYLYGARTGALERQVTSGEWTVLDVVRVDEDTREVWLTGGGRESGDPYFNYLYRVGLDGGDVRLVTPDSANHFISISPDGQYVVDSHSTPVRPPVTVLRDRDGRALMTLEQADISMLVASGWQPPMPFSVKARDGRTDLYGLLFRPQDFDPTRSYPVVNYLYPGPQSGSVGSRSFRSSHRDLQAIAELGFVVVEVDGMGTPGRSKAFQDAYFGDMGDNGLPDQVAALRQLAERYPWIDVDRVGIYGHSGGGFAAAGAILRYPGFYDVAVAQAGNHDNRNYEDDWGEKWQGLLERNPDGTTNYDAQANQLLAQNLVGKLLIAHGTADTNVPVSSTMLLVNALIEANKDFDLLLLPNRNHGFGNEPYMVRRRWDYFVRNLLGAEPPVGYEVGRLGTPPPLS
jgi:dipeptidyl aminopeptidase/acylaminoacyl peptidase